MNDPEPSEVDALLATLEGPFERWVPLGEVFGQSRIPESVAHVIEQALERMVANGDVDHRQRWLALERWAADYLAGY